MREQEPTIERRSCVAGKRELAVLEDERAEFAGACAPAPSPGVRLAMRPSCSNAAGSVTSAVRWSPRSENTSSGRPP